MFEDAVRNGVKAFQIDTGRHPDYLIVSDGFLLGLSRELSINIDDKRLVSYEGMRIINNVESPNRTIDFDFACDF